MSGKGILGVASSHGRSGEWHWVVVESNPVYGWVMHDPDHPLPGFATAPAGIDFIPLSAYTPARSWIQLG